MAGGCGLEVSLNRARAYVALMSYSDACVDEVTQASGLRYEQARKALRALMRAGLVEVSERSRGNIPARYRVVVQPSPRTVEKVRSLQQSAHVVVMAGIRGVPA